MLELEDAIGQIKCTSIKKVFQRKDKLTNLVPTGYKFSDSEILFTHVVVCCLTLKGFSKAFSSKA